MKFSVVKYEGKYSGGIEKSLCFGVTEEMKIQ